MYARNMWFGILGGQTTFSSPQSALGSIYTINHEKKTTYNDLAWYIHEFNIYIYMYMNVDDLFWLYLYQRASILFHASLATTKGHNIYKGNEHISSSTFLLCLLHAVSIPHLLAHSFDKKFLSFQTFTLCYAIWALLLPLLDLLFSPKLVQI